MPGFSIKKVLLLLFLFGNGAGMLVSGIGYWSMEQSRQHITWIEKNSLLQINLMAKIHQSLNTMQIQQESPRRNQNKSGQMAYLATKTKEDLAELQRNCQCPRNRGIMTEIQRTYAELLTMQSVLQQQEETDPKNAPERFQEQGRPLYQQMKTLLDDAASNLMFRTDQVYQESMANHHRSKLILLFAVIFAGLFFTVVTIFAWRFVSSREKLDAGFLREQKKYQALFESSNDAILVLDSRGFVNCNPAALIMFHLPSVVLFRSLSFSDISAPKQTGGRPTDSEIQHRIELAGINQTQHFEWLFKRHNGDIFPADTVMGAAQLDGETLIQLTIHDITQQKKDELSLRLAAEVFENSLDGIIITNGEGKILTVNRVFSEVTGYSRDEVLGRDPSLLQSGKHDSDFYMDFWHSLATTGQWQGEIWNRRKNGEIYAEWMNVSSVKSEDGDTLHYISVFSDITERKRSEDKIIHQAYHDALTNLPNRVLFKDRLEQALAFAQRLHHQNVAVLFMDLDRFKFINDTLGHDAGDHLLQEVAKRLRKCVRATDTVARLGGDEFTILLPEVDHADEAILVASKVLESMKHPFILSEQEIFVTVSIGISIYPNDGENVGTLMKNADTAMYHVKGQGRAGFHLYTNDLSLQTMRRLELQNQLYNALDRNEFILHYQIQTNIVTGEIIGVEALIRWQHPTLGLVPPIEFIPVAEETGLIQPIGAWVLEEACCQARNWLDMGFPLQVAVNLSGRQFHKKDLTGLVTRTLHLCGLPPEFLELEITESVAMENTDHSMHTLQSITQIGVQTAIDDFGTGYSSLSQLKKMPLHTLKIDRSFIKDLMTDSDDSAIVTAIITMAHNLGLKVIAEGVETAQQLQRLHELGCDRAQGFFLGRPVPPDEITALLKPENGH
ncbi:MAG: EAL domain-containing protein [Sulfuricella denitrificans]|nr:EAL domain-containing protein [Sulfuricella denitrificans]